MDSTDEAEAPPEDKHGQQEDDFQLRLAIEASKYPDLRVDLEATDHGSNASEDDADEAAAKQAVKTAEKRLESATTLPKEK